MSHPDWTTWPTDWPARKAGHGCHLCDFLRTEDPAWGIHVYTGRVANAYLWARGRICGYCVVIWRSGHACEPTDLADIEAAHLFADVLDVGRALTTLLQPSKLNYQILGNAMPHLHVHVVPRAELDPNPNGPLPWTYLDEGQQPLHLLNALAHDLRRLLPAKGVGDAG